MVDIAPFKSLRFASPNKSNNSSDLISPPYDVISSQERAALVRRSKNNIVQLELPAGEGASKYANAARLLERWENSGVLQEDREPSFYLLETKYRIKDAFAPSTPLVRHGVLVALRLETPGKGDVRPHERTLPKAKEDRLNLISSVQTNISSVFGLFFDRKREWPRWIKRVKQGKPIMVGTEKKNLSHRLWKIENSTQQQALHQLLKTKELYIADGHHRYEVAWAYKEARLKGEPAANLSRAWNYVMTYICPMEEPGLLLLPTHRLVKTDKSHPEWVSHLQSIFDVNAVSSLKDLVGALARPRKNARSLGWVCPKGYYLLNVKKDIALDRILEHRPLALRGLDVIVLHDLVLGEASGIEFLKEKTLIPTRDIDEIQRRAKASSSWVGFILAPCGVDALARVASSGEVMPPKTTYFYPKVPTGFTMMPLNQIIRSSSHVPRTSKKKI